MTSPASGVECICPVRSRCRSPQEVLAGLEPDLAQMTRAGLMITAFAATDPGLGYEVKVRSFAPSEGIAEDPVCGSGNACVGAYLARTGTRALPFGYRASQGREVGRDGEVLVEVSSDGPESEITVSIGGSVVELASGELRL